MSCKRRVKAGTRQGSRAAGQLGSGHADRRETKRLAREPKVGGYVKCDGLGEVAVSSHGQVSTTMEGCTRKLERCEWSKHKAAHTP
jgi:hypothetical protein